MADTDSGAPRRVHYFNGQLLDATDFTAEQDYHVDMRRRLNRFLHGSGVAGDVEEVMEQLLTGSRLRTTAAAAPAAPRRSAAAGPSPGGAAT